MWQIQTFEKKKAMQRYLSVQKVTGEKLPAVANSLKVHVDNTVIGVPG